MESIVAEARIPVDFHNPGQVFACMGLLEMADALLGNTVGGFDWGGNGPMFELRSSTDDNPLQVVLEFFNHAEVEWISPKASISERDGGRTVIERNVCASSEPSPADLPGHLVAPLHGRTIKIPFGYWADGSGLFRTAFKKSTNGASCSVRTGNALNAIHELFDRDKSLVLEDPLNIGTRTESLFRMDVRGYVDPIGVGFSPDTLRKGDGTSKTKTDVRVLGYPFCEMLSVIGLEYARPTIRSRGQFSYRVWRVADRACFLPPQLARVAFAGALPFLEYRTFVAEHVEVKQGGDRKITSVIERSLNHD